jgi:hypothetical protein
MTHLMIVEEDVLPFRNEHRITGVTRVGAAHKR